MKFKNSIHPLLSFEMTVSNRVLIRAVDFIVKIMEPSQLPTPAKRLENSRSVLGFAVKLKNAKSLTLDQFLMAITWKAIREFDESGCNDYDVFDLIRHTKMEAFSSVT